MTKNLTPISSKHSRQLSAGGRQQSEIVPPMIQMQTRLDVADNTGAKEVMCIKVLGGSASRYKRRTAGLGDTIIASVKKASSGGDVKAGEVVRCVIVRTRNQTRRSDGLLPSSSTATRSS